MEKLLTWSNIAFFGFIAGLLASLVMAYPLADSLSMSVQVAAHISTMLFAIGIKVSYIARLASLKALGRPII
ncbi:hypothetical protein [Hydrocarboniclastica marina]|uniref:Uncharacterized protein n=1 Tax=Hydrocarboniclastica marina TaxID=2259620 RepID=A0A4P7XKC8_9ALTE|nr:hypothetical protein [Hydrocarboniclastica marina]MAM00253.1 hypothetical protein [Alteromonadaceae bacterium]QCF27581.1 hypothetical protein soil367_17560 [Hydrocarboniclastica marina]|tara:strand:- start:648 stop:863 length:216 start_codon:yes stop_codon:yes gene_type:complete